MRKQLFAVNGKKGPMFINPDAVIAVFKVSDGVTRIWCADGDSIDCSADIQDVVDRYQTAIGDVQGYSVIVAKMEKYTRAKEVLDEGLDQQMPYVGGRR